MCKNATATAANLMAAIEPTIKSLLTATGQINTPNGIAAMNAYNQALSALQGWKSGTSAQNVLELMTAFESVFTTLPLPPNVAMFTNIIIGGITAVVGIITANSPAPVPVAPAPAGMAYSASEEETQAMHQADVAATTSVQIAVLVPGFKRSIFHSPESQYKSVWNKQVDANPSAGVSKV